MRIVHVITRLIIGGAQENTLLSCEGLADRGHEVYLLSGPTTGPEGSLVDRARSGNYVFEILPNLVRRVHPLRDLSAMLALQRRFEAIRPDVVHTHSSKAGILGRLAAHRARVPHIVHTIHGMSFNRTQPFWLRHAYSGLERYCAGKCHTIVTVADAMTRQALDAGIGTPTQYQTIRSGMEVERFDPSRHDAVEMRSHWNVTDDEILVGTVARLFANKGYEQLIEVMSLALKQQPELKFVWIGDGAGRSRYEETLRERGLRDRVIITGLVPPPEMPAVLAGIDLLAHTSQWEGLPRAVVQAMLMEKPAVCFAIDGTPEVVLPGVNGELIDLGDLKGFAAAVVSLANQTARRQKYGSRGREVCLRAFDHRVMVDQLDEVYRLHKMK